MFKGVLQMKKEYDVGNISQRELAKKYNISQSHVGNILREKCWESI